MWKLATLSLLALLTAPAFPQAQRPMAFGPAASTDRMAIPPPVSGEAYPVGLTGDARSNLLRAGLSFRSGYIDNLYPGSGSGSLSETTFTVLPIISLDQTTARQHRSVIYSPGFTFYRPTSALNEIDQNATLAYEYLLTPHLAMRLNDAFVQSSTTFGSANSGYSSGVSGSPPTMISGILAPFAQRLTNYADGRLSMQVSPYAMLGAAGTVGKLHYPKPSEAEGLFDSDERGGSAFYIRRIALSQYIGAGYRYGRILAYPAHAESTTETNTVYAFYSLYPKQGFSFSLSGGPQHYQVDQTALPTAAAWEPFGMASMNWQSVRANISTAYSHQVNAGGGLVGAYRSDNADAAVQWRTTRTWRVKLSGDYATEHAVARKLLIPTLQGHSIGGAFMVEHPINEQLDLNLEYDRLHQSFVGVPVILNNPDSNRGMITLTWQLDRPLGR